METNALLNEISQFSILIKQVLLYLLHISYSACHRICGVASRVIGGKAKRRRSVKKLRDCATSCWSGPSFDTKLWELFSHLIMTTGCKNRLLTGQLDAGKAT